MGADLNLKNLNISDAKKYPGLIIRLVALLVFAVFSLSWSQSCRKTDEAGVVKDLLRTVAGLSEKKDISRIMGYLSPEYRDFEGRNLEQTTRLLEYYFENYPGIAIHLLDIYVEVNGDRAEAEADLLLSSGPLETLRKMVGLIGSYYRFNFSLGKTAGRWKIIYAAWREVDSNSLLPGSRAILKKIFPGQL